jgi:uncharacterized membrane protein HdeD (DUF308 family)
MREAMQPNDKDFLKSQFDKIYVGVFIVLAGIFLIHVMHHSTDSSNVNQAWGLVTFFLGLLSGLITGRHIGTDNAENTKSLLIKESPGADSTIHVDIPKEKP